MDDITIPHEEGQDDDAFYIRPVRDSEESSFNKPEESIPATEGGHSLDNSEVGHLTSVEDGQGASSKVRIQFAKFVQLVANHSYIDIVDKNADQEVIISSNLLTDLANAHDRVRERRMQLIFMAGLVIGIILTYIIVK